MQQPSQPASMSPTLRPGSQSSGNHDNNSNLHLEFYEHKPHILDLETGQTGIGDGHYLDQRVSISSCSLFKEGQPESPNLPYKPQVPLANQLGKEHLQNGATLPKKSSDTQPSLAPSSQFSPYHNRQGQWRSPKETPNHIPPVSSKSPPPLPVTPPFSCPPMSQLPVGVFGKGGRGALGTVQFAGMSFATAGNDKAGSSSMAAADHCRDDNNRHSGEEEMTAPLAQEERKTLLLEISTIGQTGLKPTNQPRSPGGTPIRRPNSEEDEIAGDGGGQNVGMISMNSPSYNHHQQQRNSDLLQKALFAKFRSLHSTPLGHKGGSRQLDYSNSFDFSSAWSDINSSVQVYDDPDISNTTTSPSSHQTSGNKSSRHNVSSAV